MALRTAFTVRDASEVERAKKSVTRRGHGDCTYACLACTAGGEECVHHKQRTCRTLLRHDDVDKRPSPVEAW